MHKTITSLKELVFPKFCVICAKSGFEVCFECQLPWLGLPNKDKLNGLTLYYMRDYDDQSSKLILLAKEGSNNAARELISKAIFTSIKLLVSEQRLINPISIVTIPSSRKSIMRRGRDHINEICIEVIDRLGSNSITAFNTPILTQVRKVRDQSKLNRVERLHNLENAYSLKDRSLDNGACILVDDLITTGSSISEAIRALSEAKITIQGVVTACAVGRNSLIR